jgi:type II secretory pathway pseudopilin PulG
MVAIAVMGIVFAAIFTLMQSSIRASTTTLETTDTQQGLRIAHEAISRDLYSAGDGLIGINNIRLPLGFMQNYLSSQSASVLDPDADGFVQISLISSDDNVPAGKVLVNGPAGFLRTGTDRLTILQIDPSFTQLSLPAGNLSANGSQITISPADAGRFSTGEIYYLSNGTTAAFGTVTSVGGTQVNFAAGDTYGLNQTGATNGFFSLVSNAGTLSATLLRMRLIHYYVTDTGLLVRRIFGIPNAGHQDSVIAEHVTALDFRYLVNLNNPDGTLRQPLSQLVTTEERNSVRQVEVAITLETTRPLPHNGQRANFTARQQITVRNLQFREALQPTSGVIE